VAATPSGSPPPGSGPPTPADLVADRDYVVCHWTAGGSPTGDTFDDVLTGAWPDSDGRTIRFAGIAVVKIVNGLVTEEARLENGGSVLQQLIGLITGC
jgi:SnoaL-like polyketide cyclase